MHLYDINRFDGFRALPLVHSIIVKIVRGANDRMPWLVSLIEMQ